MKNKKGFTLVEIMIVVAIIALLAAIAIPNLLRAKISANEALATGQLRTLSTAAETYATTNNGNYPLTIAVLMDATNGPAYITKDPCAGTGTASGYTYTCPPAMTAGGYTFVATPSSPGVSGTKVFTMSTGGNLTSVDSVAP